MSQIIDTSWHPLVDGVPPDWASCWGLDRFGVWAGFTILDATQRLRWIPPGRFLMGSSDDEAGRDNDEGPQHEVSISQGFWLGDTTCTEELWEAVTGHAPHRRRGAHFPVANVSWNDVAGFIQRVNLAIPSLALLLPSEAQWEYACRAGTRTPFHLGTKITQKSVCYESGAPVAVGSLPANAWGLHEMHGNVWEWCSDHFHQNYRGAPADGSAWIEVDRAAAGRVLRGGSWFDEARDVRSAYRRALDPADRFDYVGFRCSRGQ
jgi:formylglycine-generating enzyme required for sulfatase activity